MGLTGIYKRASEGMEAWEREARTCPTLALRHRAQCSLARHSLPTTLLHLGIGEMAVIFRSSHGTRKGTQ